MNKFCIHCGQKLEDNDKFCGKCGKTSTTKPKKNDNYFAITGFVLTIVVIILMGLTLYNNTFFYWILGTIFSVCGLVFSIIGFLKSKKCNDYRKALSITGIIINILLIAFSLLIIGIAIIFLLLY